MLSMHAAGPQHSCRPCSSFLLLSQTGSATIPLSCAGVGVRRHAEQAGAGAEAMARAVSDTLASEAAGPLLDEAAASFRDAAVSSVIQWGNVHILRADRLLQVRPLLAAVGRAAGRCHAWVCHHHQTEREWGSSLVRLPGR